MYFRSAPLQNTPPEPRMITQRTLSSRASCSPALRKSWAVATSIELNRSRRSIVMIPTAPSLVMSIGGIGQPPPAAARAAEGMGDGSSSRAWDAPRANRSIARARSGPIAIQQSRVLLQFGCLGRAPAGEFKSAFHLARPVIERELAERIHDLVVRHAGDQPHAVEEKPAVLVRLGERQAERGDAGGRSEERRVGKECRSRWSP